LENVLITGITGFVGANLAKKLQDKYNVVGIVRDQLPICPLTLLEVENVTLVRGDINDFRLVQRVITDYDIDTIFHLAAQSIVRRAAKSVIPTFETNVIGTLNILEACRDSAVDVILFASTDKVYGERLNAKETDPLNPKEIYGASKAAADIIARVYAKNFDMNIIVTRACNIYGPGDINPRIIPNTIRACLKGHNPIIYKGMTSKREYIYIDDVVRAYMFLAENIKGKGEVFNVGSGEVKDQEEVVFEILNHFPHLDANYVDITVEHMEIGEQSLNFDKIRKLGWKPKVDFEDGIEKTVEWFKEIAKKYHQVI